jgi:flagella basal body P-ring formation protein FlgA
MTRSRVQTNRSAVTAGTRKPGELYVSIPNLQLGLIDASQTPNDLLAVRFFSPNASYPVGVFVVANGTLYVSNTSISPGAFNPAQWTKIGP